MKMKLIFTIYFALIVGIASSQTIYQAGNHTLKNVNGTWSEIVNNEELPISIDKVILKFNSVITEKEINLLEQEFGLSLEYISSAGYYRFGVTSSDYPELIRNISAESSIIHHELNYLVPLSDTPNDNPLYIQELLLSYPNLLWPYENTGIYDAWDLTTGSSNITVAIIDNGIYAEHEDIGKGNDNYSNLWENPEEKYGSLGVDDDNNGKIDDINGWDFTGNGDNNLMHYSLDNIHGTRIAGIIGAKTNNGVGVYGIAGGFNNKGVNLMILKVAADGNSIQSTLVPQAIDYAVAKGAKVINMSFGSETEISSWYGSIGYAYDEDVVMLASAGNKVCDNANTSIMYPARYDEVIAVGATCASLTDSTILEVRWESYGEEKSATGPELEIMAPGVAFSTEVMGNPYQSSYNYFGTNPIFSTSKSCAFATGVVALMRSVNPCLTIEEIREILKNTNDPLDYTYDQDGHSDLMGYGRINALAAIQTCLNNSTVTSITSNTTWNNDMNVNRNVVIESGGTLTIEDCIITSKQPVKFIVKQGGKLIVNRATLTGACNNTWKGIEVWGNNNQHQWYYNGSSYYQGYVSLNQAIIENAEYALNLWKPGDFSSTGGIVIANNTTFRNNTNSLHALDYKNFHPVNLAEMDYQAIFDNCIFEITSTYIPTYRFFKHVDISNIRGIKFIGCDFSLSSLAQNVDNFSYGIAACNAGFSANAICRNSVPPCPVDQYDRCAFTGFRHAIGVNNTFKGDITFYINRASFDNNIFGVQINNVKNFVIVNSTFKVGSITSTDCAYGIYMEASNGFSIEENVFDKKDGAISNNTVGIYTSSTNEMDDIYRNQFNNLTSGNYALGINFKTTYWSGLQYLCNQNSGNFADFYVQHLDELGDDIQAHQGNRALPAGNTFSQNATWHFYNGGDHLVGYYFSPSLPEQIPDIDKIFQITMESVSLMPTEWCISNYGSEDPIDDVVLNQEEKLASELNYATALNDYNEVETLYNSLIDGGSTIATVNDINSAMPEDMLQLKEKLLGASPHLSEEVLRLVSDKTDIFPDVAIFDILAANPDELKNEDLIAYMENKDNPLPDYMIDILRQVATGTTYKTVLQEELEKYGRSKSKAANAMIRSILNEETMDLAQLRNWLDNRGDIEADKQIISTYLEEGDFTSALSLAEMLPNEYNLSGMALDDYNAYIYMLNLAINLQQTGRTYKDLSTDELLAIDNIIDNNFGFSSSIAKSFKSGCTGISYCDCPLFEENSGNKKVEIDLGRLAKEKGFNITVSPNPAKSWTVFKYSLPDEKTTGIIKVIDQNGKIIQTFSLDGKEGELIWDTSRVLAGSYIYTMISGSFVKSDKIVVIK